MRVTWDHRIDLDLSAAATCADIVAYLGRHEQPPAAIWCGAVRLDHDHRAGVPPLIHAASLTAEPSRPDVCLGDPHLAVICGPDAGHMIPLGSTDVSIGRAPHCDLPLRDDAVSTTHAWAGFNGSAWVRDAGSRNGTQLIHDNGRRTRRRRLRPHPGEHIVLGHTVIELRPQPRLRGESRQSAPASASQLSAIGAGAMTGIVLAAVTGRWYFALLALAYPLTMGVPMLVRHLRAKSAVDQTASPPSDPCPQLDPMSPDTPATLVDPQVLEGPVAIVGQREHAVATARGIVLAQRVRPHDDEWEEPWMRWLARADRTRTVLLVREGESPPSWARTVIEADAAGTTVRNGTLVRGVGRCWVSEQTADALARRLAGALSTDAMPAVVSWADLERPTPARVGRTLSTGIGVNAEGTVVIDLDTHGPHLLVAGTTGSGKSALLETLVLGLAHEHSPEHLVIALIDFKGGAGLRHCMGLPHVVGCLTDLDPHLADRALVALSAELEDRKRALAAAGYGSFSEWEVAGDAPPRLLVVADEYQEIAQHHRDFMPHLARLAAQGRSLGLHLVLATQRPAGAVTPEIRANVTTTIALRVASAAESQDLLGSADAAHLPVDRPGRAIMAFGTRHIPVHIARPAVDATAPVRIAGQSVPAQPAQLAAAAARRWGLSARHAALWRDPLPLQVPLPDPERDGHSPGPADSVDPTLMLGLADWPTQRRQDFIRWDPSVGPLAIVGPRGSGRTGALRLLAAQAADSSLTPVWLPPDAREAARTIVVAEGRDDVLLLVDNAGSALASLSEADHGAPYDMLLRRLARGAPTALALAAHDPARLASAAGARLILSGSDSADDALWNVPRPLAGRPLVPGRARHEQHGQWCEVQLCVAPPASTGNTAPLAGTALVSTLPSATEVAARCATDPLLLGIGGDEAQRIYLKGSEVTIVGAPCAERAIICAHVERVARLAHSARPVTTRDDLAIFPGAPRITGTVILVRATPRSVRDACGAATIGITDLTPVPGRVVIVQEAHAWAVQLPQ